MKKTKWTDDDIYNKFISESVLELLREHIYVEDGQIRIRSKLKYDIYNLIALNDEDYLMKLVKDYDLNGLELGVEFDDGKN